MRQKTIQRDEQIEVVWKSSSGALSNYLWVLFLLVVIGVEVGIGILAIRDVRLADSQAQRIYAGGVQGLRRIGELQYDAQETRQTTLYALTTDNGNLQV